MIRRKRRAYLDHFTKNAAGEYVYSGDCYTFQNVGKSRKRALTELWVYFGCAAAAVLAAGCIPAPGVGHCAYVLIPYVASLIAVFSCIWTVGQLTAGGDPMREYVYLDSVEKLPRRSVITAVCELLALVGEFVFLLRNGAGERLAYGLLFLVLMAGSTLAVFLGRRCISRLKWSK